MLDRRSERVAFAVIVMFVVWFLLTWNVVHMLGDDLSTFHQWFDEITRGAMIFGVATFCVLEVVTLVARLFDRRY